MTLYGGKIKLVKGYINYLREGFRKDKNLGNRCCDGDPSLSMYIYKKSIAALTIQPSRRGEQIDMVNHFSLYDMCMSSSFKINLNNEISDFIEKKKGNFVFLLHS